METHKSYYDPALVSYIDVLKNEHKFKAKVQYTLTCINNCLASSGAIYISNLEYLSKHAKSFIEIGNTFCQSSVLEPISGLFQKFQEIGLKGIAKQFLDIIEKGQIQGDISQNLIVNVCNILKMVRHQYPKAKTICMKLLENSSAKLTQKQISLIINTMSHTCSISKQQCYKLSQLPNMSPVTLLELLWVSCLNTKNDKQKAPQSFQYNIINKYLQQFWDNETIKQESMRISIWNATNSGGNIEQLKPEFIDKFYKSKAKPLWDGAIKSGVNKLDSILQHLTNQPNSLDENKLKQLYSKFPQQSQIIKDIANGQQISLDSQTKYINILPIQVLTKPETVLNKLTSVPTPSNAFKVICKLYKPQFKNLADEKVLKIYLTLLQIYLCNKEHEYLKIIEQIILFKLGGNKAFILDILSKNQENCLFISCAIQIIQKCSAKEMQPIYTNVNKFLVNESIKIQYKFYIAASLLKLKYEKGVWNFIHFLERALSRQNLPYEELAHYIRNYYFNEEQLGWLNANFEEELERILQKIFGKLTDHDFKPCKQIIFALEKYEIFQEWHPIYRWTLNPLDDPNFENEEGLIDSFEVFESVSEKCKNIPPEVIKKFFHIVTKNWENYTHHHLFTIERISLTLFSDQDLNPHDLTQISTYIKQLMNRQWKTSNSQLYNQSLSLMLKNTLMEETENIDQNLIKSIYKEISKIDASTSKNYQNLKMQLFAQQLLMWRFQYEDDTIHQKVAQNLIKIVNSHDSFQFVNEADLQLLVQNSLQIISTVGHDCNLLQLSLVKVLRNYPKNKHIISFAIEIICNIKDVNIKALSKFQLQSLIPQILTSLIFNSNQQINKLYSQFLHELCCDKESPYYPIFIKNIQLLTQILRSQGIFITEEHRPEIVEFAIENLASALGSKNVDINQKWVENIWIKYYRSSEIKRCCGELIGELEIGRNIISMIEKQKPEIINEKIVQVKEEILQIKEHEKSPPKIQAKVIETQIEENISNNEVAKEQIKKPKNFNIQVQKVNNEQYEIEQKICSPPKSPTKLKFAISTQEPNETEQNIRVPQIGIKRQKDKDPEKGFGFGSTKISKANSNKTEEKPVKRKRSIQKQQEKQNINNIKGHINYISSITDKKIDEVQKTKLEESFSYLTDVVSIHPYYCQKVVNLGLISKCFALHPDVQQSFVAPILELLEEMSKGKEKNLTILNDQKSIQFFKRILKQSVNSRKQKPQTETIIRIIKKCWNSASDFYAHGLLSMLFEMAKLDLNRQNILQLLSTNALSYQIVNQIYQRGLFNIMQIIFKQQNSLLTPKDKVEICYWTRLMGKVCVNNSIRQKLFSLAIHKLTYQKIQVYEEMKSVNSLAFFYANFVFEYQKMANWCIEQKIPQYFLTIMERDQDIISPDFYKFFRYFSQNGKQFVEYLFRVKYHMHMIEMIKDEKSKIPPQAFKHFCKSISHLFVPEHYEIFIKSQIVPCLLNRYKNNNTFYVIECIQKLVDQIKEMKELQILQKQGLFQVNEYIFLFIGSALRTKLKDDMSYSYILQMYMNLFKKFKRFNSTWLNCQFAYTVIRKGLFSINMEGKRKVIEFLMEFSEIDKISYGYGTCFKIFQSLFNYSMTYDELALLYRFEQIELKYDKPTRGNQQQGKEEENKFPSRFKKIIDLTSQIELKSLISNKYIDLRNKLEYRQESVERVRKQLDITVDIILLFMKVQHNALYYFQKLKGNIFRMYEVFPYCFESSVKLINEFMKFKTLLTSLRNYNLVLLDYVKKMGDYLDNSAEINDTLIKQYLKIIQCCLKNNIVDRNNLLSFITEKLRDSKIKNNEAVKEFFKSYQNFRSEDQLSQPMKQIMKKGIKVKMYKIDGSYSPLLLYFTPDLLELNCVVSIGEPVKSKWKLPINQISYIQDYNNEEVYKQSVFYLSQGLFSKAPLRENCLTVKGRQKQKGFYICFDNNSQLKQWKKYILLAKGRAEHFLGTIMK